MANTESPPNKTVNAEAIILVPLPVTIPRPVPMIGTPRGATIMAPMTVAVESASKPAVAITADRINKTANFHRFVPTSPTSRKSCSPSSSSVRRWPLTVTIALLAWPRKVPPG
jgi:hypothetical protein